MIAFRRFVAPIMVLTVVLFKCRVLPFFVSRSMTKMARNSFNLDKISLMRSFSGRVTFQRLERIISNRGAGSRKEVAALIKRGKVSVEGKVIKNGSDRFPVCSNITIDGKPVLEAPIIALYNKPLGVHSTVGDPWNRLNLSPLYETHSFLKTLHPVGRLDADSSGLLLFCRDGALTQFLLSPQSLVEREYVALVEGKVNTEKLKNILSAGVETSDGKFEGLVSDSCSAEINGDLINFDLSPSFNGFIPKYFTSLATIQKISDSPTEISKTLSCVRLSVTEGKYRMVRRILHNAGHSVLGLHRIRYGSVTLLSSRLNMIGSGENKGFSLSEGDLVPCDEETKAWASNLLKK